MTVRQLRELLDQVADTRELVLRGSEGPGPSFNVVYAAWRDARDDARVALVEWLASGGAEAYAAYRAAQDREDVAQDGVASALRTPVQA